MKTKSLTIIAGVLTLCCCSRKAAAAITLAEALSNVDSTVVDVFADFGAAGLGSIAFTVSGAGSHHVSLFMDHEIDEADNTFFNEFGNTAGALAAGQTWEIDEPGHLFGDIYDHFVAGTFDETNGVPSAAPDDVSMALGWNFVLAPGETASVRFSLSEIRPSAGFFLAQTDPHSDKTIYFSSTNTIDGGSHVPDTGTTLALFGMGLAVIGGARSISRRRAAP